MGEGEQLFFFVTQKNVTSGLKYKYFECEDYIVKQRPFQR
jgi:hypothetical protein